MEDYMNSVINGKETIEFNEYEIEENFDQELLQALI
jgi:hypothetical protein